LCRHGPARVVTPLAHWRKTRAKQRAEASTMSKPVLKGLPPIRAARRGRCAMGRHVAETSHVTDERGVVRSRCRLCGADLVRLIGRSWIVSATLG
jgi:hypothetical protein